MDTDFAGYGEIAKEALQVKGMALNWVPRTRADFGELAMVAVLADGEAHRSRRVKPWRDQLTHACMGWLFFAGL